MYTTVTKVRNRSGLQNSTNITDPTIRDTIMFAANHFDGAIAYRYSLPLAYHRSNTLVFSGLGSGTGTMAIVVNGTTYNVSVTSGLTATAAADLFRVAVKDAVGTTDDFVTDPVGSGTEVLLISKTDSSTAANLATASAEVNITSAPTTTGISGAIGSRVDRYSPNLVQVVTELASALLLKTNYGVEAADSPKDGNVLSAEVQVMLAQIQGTTVSFGAAGASAPVTIRLYDEVTKEELTLATTDSPLFFPDSTGENDDGESTLAKVTINQKL